MAEKGRLGKREVDALHPNSQLLDPALPGFGARRRAGQDVSFFVWYRNADGRARRVTIGTHGKPWTVDQARRRALDLLAQAKVDGGDPAAEKRARRSAPTVSELCDRYLADAETGRLLTRRGASKKPATLATDRSRITAHIKPLLGALKVPAVTPRDVRDFMAAVMEGRTARRVATGRKGGLSNVRGGRGAAARTMGLLGALFSYAVREGDRADNPVTGIVRPADGRRERRLSDAEYASLGTALRKAAEPPKPRADGKPGGAAPWPAAVACARFLALTGWRSGEALKLRRREVDFGTRSACLGDTKTGSSLRPLSRAACVVLRGMGDGPPDSMFFAPSRGEGHMAGFSKQFARLAALAKLPADVTPHVLRHSFASLAADLGYATPTIAALVGHKGQDITSRYIHSADAVLLAAADKVAGTAAERMGDASPGVVVALPTDRRDAAAA